MHLHVDFSTRTCRFLQTLFRKTQVGSLKFSILCIYNKLPYWQLDFDRNEENKKKVVAKVVDFPDFDI